MSEEHGLFLSVLRVKKVKRKQFVEQPGYVSTHRSYVVKRALRAFFIDADGQQQTISLAVDDGWIGDPGSLEEPATLFVVNLATPGAITTPGGDEGRQLLTAGILPSSAYWVPSPYRAGTAEELAETIAFLVSERASYTTGHNLFVSGGHGELA